MLNQKGIVDQNSALQAACECGTVKIRYRTAKRFLLPVIYRDSCHALHVLYTLAFAHARAVRENLLPVAETLNNMWEMPRHVLENFSIFSVFAPGSRDVGLTALFPPYGQPSRNSITHTKTEMISPKTP